VQVTRETVGEEIVDDFLDEEPIIEPAEPEAPIVRYQFTLEELRDKLSAMERPDAMTTPSAYRQGVTVIARCRNWRVQVEARRKQLKASSLDWGRRVDAAAKELVAAIESVELPVKQMKAEADTKKERVKREKEEAARAAREEQIRKAREAEEARLRAVREAEERRLAAERAELLVQQRKLREEQARQDAIEAERQAKLKAEREAFEAELEAQRAMIAAEEKRIAELKAQAEREERERQDRIRAEQEAEELAARKKAEAEEQERLEAERKAAAAARLEALKPDKERAIAYLDGLLDVSIPEVADLDIESELSDLRTVIFEFRNRIAVLGET